MKISINSLLHGLYKKVDNSQWVIVFVHGLTSSKNEPIISQWMEYFNKKWYSTFVFNLYGDQNNKRKLTTNSLDQNIQDINSVVNDFVQQWQKNIILIWHSFGWLALLYVDTVVVAKIVLWDASIGWEELLWDVYKDELWRYIDWWDSYRHYISDQLYQDFCIDPQVHIRQLQSIEIPIVIISAEHGLQTPAQAYAQTIQQVPFVITWADHTFSDNMSKKELFETTLQNL